jgi:phosphoglycolate phosphatase-like HAD superfamily hydrolase
LLSSVENDTIRLWMRPTILLFDIDGTLVTTPGCGRRALERAFMGCYGRTGVLRDVRFDGMTDRVIVRRGLASLGDVADGPAAEAAIDAILAAYVPLLEEEIAETQLTLHRGAREVLAAVVDRAGVAVGLGTGNIRPGARAKLAPLGVFEHFRFGGFGCDHEDRHVILRLGQERGAMTLAAPVAACRTIVIGDTPRDVLGAGAIGAECVAVASARFTRAELGASGATRVVDDLTDPAVLSTLLGDG